MELLVTSAFIAAVLLGIFYAAMKYWPFTLAFLAMCVLAVSCSKADTFEVSAIIESEADRSTMQDAVAAAGSILRGQFGTDLVVTYVDISTVAGHTQGNALLDAVKAYRVDHAQHRAADATVLFTRRELIRLAGIATIGPACSAQASAIVAIRNDGNDGAILAHELLHTVGVPHDAAPGWLMSEGLSRYTSTSASPDSVLTFKSAGTAECMAPAKPAPAASTVAQQGATGGGGASGWEMILLALLAFVRRAKCMVGLHDWRMTDKALEVPGAGYFIAPMKCDCCPVAKVRKV